jgi:hypothetical protein
MEAVVRKSRDEQYGVSKKSAKSSKKQQKTAKSRDRSSHTVDAVFL